MKLLFDQNISFRVAEKMRSIFPGSKQVKEVALENTSDIKIWEYAKENGFILVSFDADFADIANIKGSPPKIIWLRTGNLTSNSIVELLTKHKVAINEFAKNIEYLEISCLEIQ